MMTGRVLRMLFARAAIAVLAMLALAAHALTPADLQKLLQASPRASVEFQESRESPWLSAPVVSRGTMRSTAASLEKRVESPRPETWRLLADRIEWQAGAGGPVKQILFKDAPALAALSDLMRRVVSGDIVALQRDFNIQVSGDERVWRAQLTPTTPGVGRQIEQVELQGTGRTLQVIIVAQRQGERTTTRLQP
jgi:hypothetical protein